MIRSTASVGPLLASPVCVVGDDLGPPAVDRASEPAQLGDVAVRARCKNTFSRRLGVAGVGGGVDVGEQFTGQDRGSDFAVGVSGVEPVDEAFPTACR